MFSAEDDDEPTFPTRFLPRARVLLVEDDPSFRSLVSRRLGRNGYDVYEAANGNEALTMLHYGWPVDDVELVILDIHLPGGKSGLEVLQQLRDEHNRTPAVLMTAFPDAEVIGEAARCGASLLIKPFSLDRLCDATIDAILARPDTLRAEGVR